MATTRGSLGSEIERVLGNRGRSEWMMVMSAMIFCNVFSVHSGSGG